MFLLNEVSYEVAKNCDLFTIQNVPIKYFLFFFSFDFSINLQYKMFLLNTDKFELKKEDVFDLQYKMFLLNLIFLKLPI